MMEGVFSRMFGRRRSPVEGEAGTDDGTEVTEEQPEQVNCDGFVVLDDDSKAGGAAFEPPPGYTVSGANAFLPYGLVPQTSPDANRPSTAESQTAIDGVPFKLGANVLLEGDLNSDLSAVSQMVDKINFFNWDDYEYNFLLERSVLQEFGSSEQVASE